jgi:hypothetical protein
MMGLKTKLGLFAIFSICLYSCYRDNQAALYPQSSVPGTSSCDTNNTSFSGAIQPIFTINCALSGCHASASPTGGYVLDNYNGIRSVVLSGRLIGAITHAAGYSAMPKDAPMLSDCDLATIISWINQGSQNN